MTSMIPASTPQLYTTLNPRSVCCKPEREIPNTLRKIINANANFSIFNCILEKSGIDIFDDCYNYTMFIPTNEYLCNIDYNNIDRSLARNIIFSSVLNEKIPSELLKSATISYYQTLNPVQNLIISCENNSLYINSNSYECVKVVYEDIMATNGIIHIINDLMMPYTVWLVNINIID